MRSTTFWRCKAVDGPQWLQLDFHEPISFNAIEINWLYWAHAVEFSVQTSDDGQKWKTIAKVTDGDKNPRLLDNLNAKGRFVRINGTKPKRKHHLAIEEVRFVGSPEVDKIVQERLAGQRAQDAADRKQVVKILAKSGVEEIIYAARKYLQGHHWYDNFGYDCRDEKTMYYRDGGQLVRLNLVTGKRQVLLDDPKGGVRDPVVHYDAKKILFSYRPAGTTHSHLFEINIDGTNLKRLTDGDCDDIEPTYLPDGNIAFVSSRCKRWVNCILAQVATLHRCDADGKNIRPISFNIEQDNTPWVLNDGRLLYMRWEYVDRSQVSFHHLWTSNPDGTNQMVFYGNQRPGNVMIDAKPLLNSRKVVSIFSPGHGLAEHNGQVVIINPCMGPDKSPVHHLTGGKDFRDPWAFDERTVMAAQEGDRIVLLAGGKYLTLERLPLELGQAGYQCHEPRPLIRRKREPIIPDRTNEESPVGYLLLSDIYIGRHMGGVKRGEIKKLLVLETLPKPVNFSGGSEPLSIEGTFTLERILGTVPVSEDGSAFIELPAKRPLFFVALDKNDMAVKRMQSFLSVMPGEVSGCVGCHEQRMQTVSPSRVPSSFASQPVKIEPITDCPDLFDFPRDIQPILDKLCVDCHGTEKTAKGGPYAGKVLLTGDRGPMYSHSYLYLTLRSLFSDGRNKPRGNYPPRAIGSSASRILRMLDGSHYDVKATAHQKKMLRLWIESAATYPGTYAALGSGMVNGYWWEQARKKLSKDKDVWAPIKAAGSAKHPVLQTPSAIHSHHH